MEVQNARAWSGVFRDTGSHQLEAAPWYYQAPHGKYGESGWKVSISELCYWFELEEMERFAAELLVLCAQLRERNREEE